MKLDKYLKKNQITSQQFATRIGASFSAVSKWRTRNRKKPRQPWLDKIAKETKGRVSEVDWSGE